MNALASGAVQPQLLGLCQGVINGTEPFSASLVELSEADYPTYPSPHERAHVMLATQIAPGPDYTYKELLLSFTKDFENGRYKLDETPYPVGMIFIDRSTPTEPVVYTPVQGVVGLEYDPEHSTFSGELSAELENRDEDPIRTLNLRVIFHAYPPARIPRNLRPPKSRARNC